MSVWRATLFLISLSSISLGMVGSQPLRHKNVHRRTGKKSMLPYDGYSQGLYQPYYPPAGQPGFPVSPVKHQKVVLQVKVIPVGDAKPPAKPTTSVITTQVPGASLTSPTRTTSAPGVTTATTGGPTSTPGVTTATTTGSPAPPTALDGFREEALDVSNTKRSIHNASPFQLDSSLNQQAQSYAEKLAAAKTPSTHSNVKGQGENLANKCSTNGQLLSGKEAVTNWYNEVQQYNFAQPGFSAATGHFTQVVWKASTKMGIGRAKYTNASGWICYVVVARYTPPGNVSGKFPQNVVKGSYSAP